MSIRMLTTGRLERTEEEEILETLQKPKAKRMRRRPPLTEEQQALAVRYLPMAKSLAKPLKQSWPTERQEFDSAALLALVEAAQSFDPTRNVKFATFARYRIWGALRDVQRGLITDGWRGDPSNAPDIGSLTVDHEELGSILGSEPDRPIGQELEALDFVEHCFSKLPPKHAEACRQLYIHGKTQTEAAGVLGCSKSRVSYLHQEALELLNDSWTYKNRLESRSKDLSNRPPDPEPDSLNKECAETA